MICLSNRNLLVGVDSGKLYVTKSVLSNGIGRLCIVILHLFFSSVKFLLLNVNPIHNILFLPKWKCPFSEALDSMVFVFSFLL
jgi:hypothetical protein